MQILNIWTQFFNLLKLHSLALGRIQQRAWVARSGATARFTVRLIQHNLAVRTLKKKKTYKFTRGYITAWRRLDMYTLYISEREWGKKLKRGREGGSGKKGEQAGNANIWKKRSGCMSSCFYFYFFAAVGTSPSNYRRL